MPLYGPSRYLARNGLLPARPGFFIEAGAFDGLIDAVGLPLERDQGWRGLNLEPVPDLYRRLCSNRPHALNLQLALWDQNCVAPFRHAIHPVHGRDFGQGSLCHTTEHLAALRHKDCAFEQYQVQCRTYPYLVEALDLPQPQLMVLDVEGTELQVLQPMIQRAIALPEILCVEHWIVGLQPLVDMLHRHYLLHGTDHNNAIFALRAVACPAPVPSA